MAIKLIEKNREPDSYEKFKLRLMRFVNGKLNGRKLDAVDVSGNDSRSKLVEMAFSPVALEAVSVH